jgi:hypothetical protein
LKTTHESRIKLKHRSTQNINQTKVQIRTTPYTNDTSIVSVRRTKSLLYHKLAIQPTEYRNTKSILIKLRIGQELPPTLTLAPLIHKNQCTTNITTSYSRSIHRNNKKLTKPQRFNTPAKGSINDSSPNHNRAGSSSPYTSKSTYITFNLNISSNQHQTRVIVAAHTINTEGVYITPKLAIHTIEYRNTDSILIKHRIGQELPPTLTLASSIHKNQRTTNITSSYSRITHRNNKKLTKPQRFNTPAQGSIIDSSPNHIRARTTSPYTSKSTYNTFNLNIALNQHPTRVFGAAHTINTAGLYITPSVFKATTPIQTNNKIQPYKYLNQEILQTGSNISLKNKELVRTKINQHPTKNINSQNRLKSILLTKIATSFLNNIEETSLTYQPPNFKDFIVGTHLATNNSKHRLSEIQLNYISLLTYQKPHSLKTTVNKTSDIDHIFYKVVYYCNCNIRISIQLLPGNSVYHTSITNSKSTDTKYD